MVLLFFFGAHGEGVAHALGLSTRRCAGGSLLERRVAGWPGSPAIRRLDLVVGGVVVRIQEWVGFWTGWAEFWYRTGADTLLRALCGGAPEGAPATSDGLDDQGVAARHAAPRAASLRIISSPDR